MRDARHTLNTVTNASIEVTRMTTTGIDGAPLYRDSVHVALPDGRSIRIDVLQNDALGVWGTVWEHLDTEPTHDVTGHTAF